MFTTIPIIDLSQASSLSTRPALLAELRHALLQVGFMYIKSHSILPETIDNLVEILPALFSLPPEVKAASSIMNSPHFLGYSNFGSETTAGKVDQREQFEIGTELPDVYAGLGEDEKSSGRRRYLRLQGPNQWPTRLKAIQDGEAFFDVRQIVTTYLNAVAQLAMSVLELIASALDLPADALNSFIGPQDRLKLLHYRPALLSEQQSGRQVTLSQGVGPHKDSSGWLTFLLQSQPSSSSPKSGGLLQVLTKSGSWIDVPPIPGTFIVNTGQAFEAATNGICKATIHRVILPPPSPGPGATSYDRYSIPFFQGVKPELTKDDFRSLWTHFGPARWEKEVKNESDEGQRIDCPFMRDDRLQTWGEAQLRTKIRSHRDVGRKFYADVFEDYVGEM